MSAAKGFSVKTFCLFVSHYDPTSIERINKRNQGEMLLELVTDFADFESR